MAIAGAVLLVASLLVMSFQPLLEVSSSWYIFAVVIVTINLCVLVFVIPGFTLLGIATGIVHIVQARAANHDAVYAIALGGVVLVSEYLLFMAG